MDGVPLATSDEGRRAWSKGVRPGGTRVFQANVFDPCGGIRPHLNPRWTADAVPAPTVRGRLCRVRHRASMPIRRATFATSSVLDGQAGRPAVRDDLSLPPYNAGAVAEIAAVLAGSCDAMLIVIIRTSRTSPLLSWPACWALAGGCMDRSHLPRPQPCGPRAGAVQPAARGRRRRLLCHRRREGAREAHGPRFFDLHGTRLAALASEHSSTVAVPGTPAAAPTALRPARLVENERAGAHVAVLNHVRTAEEVSDFVRRSRGRTHHPVVAAVTVYTDADVRAGASRLARPRARRGSGPHGVKRFRPGAERDQCRGRGGRPVAGHTPSGRGEHLGARVRPWTATSGRDSAEVGDRLRASP